MSLQAAYQREAEDAVADSHAVAHINGLVFDRHAEERNVQVFTGALRAAIEEFLADPLGPPLVPNWARVWAGVPDAGARLLGRGGEGRRVGAAGVAMRGPPLVVDRPRRHAARPGDVRLRAGLPGARRAAGEAACRSSSCSSKTRAEMEPLADAIGADGPLVVENGGAVVAPRTRGGVAPWARRGGPRRPRPRAAAARLVAALPGVAREAGVRVRPFAAMSVDEVAAAHRPVAGAGGARDAARVRRAVRGRGPARARPGRGRAPRPRGARPRPAGHARRARAPPHRPRRQGAGAAGRSSTPGPGASAATSSASATPPTTSPLLLAVDRPILVPRPDGSIDPALAARLPAAERAPGPGPAGWASGGARRPRRRAAAAGGGVSAVPLEPRVAERVRELGAAELVVGIPSYNNAATIGHVVRAVACGPGQALPGAARGHRQLGRRLQGRDAGRRGPGRARLAAGDPRFAPGLAGPPDRDAVPRGSRQGQRAADDLRDRGAAGGAGVRGRRLRPAQHHAGVGRAAARARRRPRLRLRRAALPAPQVRRHDHQLDRLPAHPRPLRAGGAPADRRGVRLLGPARLALPRASRCGRPTSPASGSTSG